ncbi:TIGR04283 family arsenosugar biosynthesis glycosyltransferase [Trichothermofontia sichuanensis B231]|uniref:TIGR04283 family arsenosugar biosynthesis glycosyltransferase n=1 Tax=Trichothermofontia sichuanensis TaxID=3045816 RepID=UPI0022461C58|nr:TIGR04283 family arsenosugar biosynthesis glycosyltransferase [Trichothermofontia sichuanensis]UZQ54309.1 TIGR04283 family arsenosugar biosynthesis glycosyltransferase [Trichothermofontia sichuanensis B231]
MILDRISVILPVLNEAGTLVQTLQVVQRASQGEWQPQQPFTSLEVIVVDGGSTDQTVTQAQTWGVTLVLSATGRAQQMNAGAAIATGEIFLFLHADTHLPTGFPTLVRTTLATPGTIAGAFDLRIAGDLPGLRWVEWGVYWRSRLCQLPYGDQALFLRREVFRSLGGFPDLPLMEDFVLVRRLQTQGKIAIVPQAVVTSARRWQQRGVWQTTLLNQAILLGYTLGVSPHRLRSWYRERSKTGSSKPSP